MRLIPLVWQGSARCGRFQEHITVIGLELL